MKDVGILGYGLYLPPRRMSAAEIAAETGGRWSETAVRDKLGIVGKSIPGAGGRDAGNGRPRRA